MGIGKIGGFYQNYSMEPIKKAETDSVTEKEKLQEQAELSGRQSDAAAQNGLPDTQEMPHQHFKAVDPKNLSLNFNAGETYDYIGKDSSMELLDMEQVISDMKKDSVLEQYRYFVGAKEAAEEFAGGLSGDGIVIVK